MRAMTLPRVVGLVAAAFCVGPFGVGEEAVTLLGSRAFVYEKLAARKTAVGEWRHVTDGPTATLERLESHITTLNAGLESHPQHQHAQEEFIVLKEGTLDVIINGEAQRIGPGSLFFFASNDFHSVANVGDGPATYLVFNYATAATKLAPAEPAVRSAAAGTLRSSVYDWDTLEVVATARGSRRNLFDAPTVTARNLRCHATTLRAGERAHAAHSHADEELVIVMAGLVEAEFSGETVAAGPGSVFFFASGDLHGLRNAGETEATYYVVRIVTEVSGAEG